MVQRDLSRLSMQALHLGTQAIEGGREITQRHRGMGMSDPGQRLTRLLAFRVASHGRLATEGHRGRVEQWVEPGQTGLLPSSA